MIQTDLTEQLVSASRTCLRKFLKEEIALAGNRLNDRSDYVQIKKQSSSCRQVLTEVQIHLAKRSDQRGKSDSVDLSRSGNDGKTIRSCVRIDLHQSGGIAPQGKSGSRSISVRDHLHASSDIPHTESLACHRNCVRGDRLNQTSGLVHGRIGGSLVVSAVDEGILDVSVDLLHTSSNLKVKFADRVCRLIRNVHTGQSTHVGHLGVGYTDSLMEDLCDIGLLRPSDRRRSRSRQRCGLRDRRLRSTTGGVFLSGNELYVICSFNSATDDGGQRSINISFVEKHTGVVQYSKALCYCHSFVLL